MPVKPRERIMMISTHGYVAAEPELGKPDTGGQVVYVLELSQCLARMGYRVDILTRQFEGQPARERVSDRVRILRFPCGGREFIPKETFCDSIREWVTNVDHRVSGHAKCLEARARHGGHAIATILKRPRVAQQLARFGTQKARSRFTWTGVGQQLLGLFQNVDPGTRRLATGFESNSAEDQASAPTIEDGHP